MEKSLQQVVMRIVTDPRLTPGLRGRAAATLLHFGEPGLGPRIARMLVDVYEKAPDLAQEYARVAGVEIEQAKCQEAS